MKIHEHFMNEMLYNSNTLWLNRVLQSRSRSFGCPHGGSKHYKKRHYLRYVAEVLAVYKSTTKHRLANELKAV